MSYIQQKVHTVDLSGTTSLQICSHTRKSAMSETRQTGERTVLPIQFHPTGDFVGKTHISQGSHLGVEN